VYYIFKKGKNKKESIYPFIKCIHQLTHYVHQAVPGNGDKRVDNPRIVSLSLFLELFSAFKENQTIAQQHNF